MSNKYDKPDVSKINVDYILDTVVSIMEKMLEEDIQKLKDEDNNKFIQKLEDEFPDFCDKYYSLFRTVIDGNDLTNLYKMLEMIVKVQDKNISIETAEKQLGEELAEEYLYPNLSNEELERINKELNK